MSDQVPEPLNSPEVRTIRELVRLMRRFDLTAIDLSSEKTTIRLRRGHGNIQPTQVTTISSGVQALTPVNFSTGMAPETPLGPASAVPGREPTYIRSPMVGTFYESPAPDAKAYVAVGDVVRADSTVCLIEAMKVFTEINAGVSGTVVELLAKSGQPVEFDQPMFRVEPS